MKKVLFILLAVLAILSVFAVLNNRENSDDFLDEELAEIESLIEKRDVKNTAVSQADVAWHLDHSLKVVNRLSESLSSSNPEDFSSDLSMSRLVVFTTGIIPRGRAQASEEFLPPDDIRTEDIIAQLATARTHIAGLSSLDEKAHMEHPVFKTLDKGQTKRLMKVHTRHHLKIIRDILRHD